MSRLLEDKQTSGNDWAKPRRAMLLEPNQECEVALHPRRQSAIFHDLELQMARAEADHSAAVDVTKKLYVFPTDSSVNEFLRDHRNIPQLLIEAAPELRKHFGNSTVLLLHTSSDEHGWQSLYVIAKWTGKVQDAAYALDQFEDNWWIANSRTVAGSLTFTYELA